MVQASVSVNRKKASRFFTMSWPGINMKEFNRRVIFMTTLFKNLWSCGYDLSEASIESMVPAQKNVPSVNLGRRPVRSGDTCRLPVFYSRCGLEQRDSNGSVFLGSR